MEIDFASGALSALCRGVVECVINQKMHTSERVCCFLSYI